MTCPRCGAAVEQRFYGPCAKCREELRGWASTVGAAAQVTAARVRAEREAADRAALAQDRALEERRVRPERGRR